MSIEFDEDEPISPNRIVRRNDGSFVQTAPSGGMSGWLVRHGIVSSGSSANAFLIALVVFNFAVAIAIYYFFVLQ